MHLAVIGSNGRTGTQVVEQALRRGHTVTAVSRRPRHGAPLTPELREVSADVTAVGQITDALAGADAVISAIGIGTSRHPTAVYSDGTRNLLAGMNRHNIARIAVVSAGGAGPRTEQPFLDRRIALPILDRIFGASYTDMRRMEALLQASDCDWIALRPPRLTTKPASGAYRVGASPLPRSRSITVADLATALLDVVDRPELYRKAVYVGN